MSKLQVYDMSGAAVRETEVADDLLVLDRGEQAVHESVLAHQAAIRAGSASTKGKGLVAGSNKKPWRQKGTGMARAGCRRSPVWRGGGVAFGPHPRSYAMDIPKKVRQMAFRRALSDRIASGALKVVEKFELADGKTKLLVAALETLKVAAPALLVLEPIDSKVEQAARNIQGVAVTAASTVGTYELVRFPTVVATSAAMERLLARLGVGAAKGQAE